MKSLPLSKQTLSWAAIIIVSATFLRQVQQLITTLGGRALITICVWCAFLVCAITLLSQLKRCTRKQLIGILLICSLAIAHALQLELAEERVHIILFGILGFLTYRDLIKRYQQTAQLLVKAVVFCTLIAAIDETLQYFLPYRVGDLRDVFFGALGAVWGILVAGVALRSSVTPSPSAID